VGRKATGPIGIAGLPNSANPEHRGFMSEHIRSITQYTRNHIRRDYLPAIVANPFPQPVRPRPPRNNLEVPAVTALAETPTDLPSHNSEEFIDAVIIHQYAQPAFPCIPIYLRRIQVSAYRKVESLKPREEGHSSYLDVYV
jgi:hypothetical protein